MERKCRIAGCGRKAVAKKLCYTHRRRLRDTGSADEHIPIAPRRKVATEGEVRIWNSPSRKYPISFIKRNGSWVGSKIDLLTRLNGHKPTGIVRALRNSDGFEIISPSTIWEVKNGLQCIATGCGQKGKALGMCRTHYARFVKFGDPLADKPIQIKTWVGPCSAPGCNRKHASRGYCHVHAARFRKHGDPQSHIPLSREPAICAVPGCGRRGPYRGYCRTHFARIKRAIKRGKDPSLSLAVPIKKLQTRRTKTCDVDSCDLLASCHGFCTRHYARFKAHGEVFPEVPIGSAVSLRRRRLKCIDPDCNQLARRYGFCGKHSQQFVKGTLKMTWKNLLIRAESLTKDNLKTAFDLSGVLKQVFDDPEFKSDCDDKVNEMHGRLDHFACRFGLSFLQLYDMANFFPKFDDWKRINSLVRLRDQAAIKKVQSVHGKTKVAPQDAADEPLPDIEQIVQKQRQMEQSLKRYRERCAAQAKEIRELKKKLKDYETKIKRLGKRTKSAV